MRYVALLRGIMPTNPNMNSEKLRTVFEGLGFANVRTVIASGNVVFDTPSKSASLLERKIEEALPRMLGFSSTTMVRSQKEIEALIARNPFKGIVDEKPNYLVVTFFKEGSTELCTTLDLSSQDATRYMASLEKKHGKKITTRTWKTVHRIMKKMEE